MKGRVIVHGLSTPGRKHSLYSRWNGIKNACSNPKQRTYEKNGGRGIKVCYEWDKNFMSFYSWAVTNGYKKELVLHRKNQNENFEPLNCEWITITKKNELAIKEKIRKIKFKNKNYSIAELADKFKMSPGVLRTRLDKGWSVEKSLEIPVKVTKNSGKKFKKFYSYCEGKPIRPHKVISEKILNDDRKRNCVYSRFRNGWNCKEAFNIEIQNYNKRFILFNGKVMPLAEAAKLLKIDYKFLLSRILRGYTPEEAISIPKYVHKNKKHGK